MQQEIGEVCLPKSNVAICFQRSRATSGPSTGASAGRAFCPTARETKASSQLVEATSHPILSAHKSTSETCTHRYSPNRSKSSSETSTMASLTVSHDHKYSYERITLSMIGYSPPPETASETRGQDSIHRHCPRDPFGCMNRLKPLKAHSVTTAVSLIRASPCRLFSSSCTSSSNSCLIGWNCLSA